MYCPVKVTQANDSMSLSSSALGEYSLVVLVDKDFCTACDIDTRCRQQQTSAENTKVVMCGVQGVCGYLLNDFRENFLVEDASGEVSKEVYYNLLHLSLVIISQSDFNSYLRLQFTCIIKFTFLSTRLLYRQRRR